MEPAPDRSLFFWLDSLRRRPGFRTALRIFWALMVGIVVFGAAIYFNSSNRLGESVDVDYVADSELDSYERIIEQGNPQEIIGFLQLNVDREDAKLPVRIELLNQRIKLAARLREISQEPKNIEVAILTNLDSRLSILQILQKSNLDTSNDLNALNLFVLGLVDSEQTTIRNAVEIADMFVQLERYRKGEIDKSVLDQSVEDLASRSIEEADLARNLVKLLDHFIYLGTDVDDTLLETARLFSGSQNPNVLDISKEVVGVFFRRDYNLIPLTAGESNFISTTISERTAVIEEVFDKIARTSIVTDRELNMLLPSLAMLVQVAPSNQTKDYLMRTKQVMENAKIVQADTKKLLPIVKVKDLLSARFPASKFIDVDGGLHPVIIHEGSSSLVVFAEAGNEVLVDRLNSITGRFNALFTDRKLGVVVVYFGEKKLENEWAALEKWANAIPNADLFHVRVEDNQEFFDAFSVPWSPCWVIVDKELVLQEFSPLYPVLRSRLHQYLN